MQYKFYIFDCDGVILDSNSFKIDAMREATSNYPQNHQHEFIEYFRKNFGKSRYHHVDVFFKDILRKSPTAGETDSIINRYAKSCRQQYLECPMCDGALELISSLDPKNSWVVSGSDQSELTDIFSIRGLSRHFEKVLGSPTKKSANIITILTEGGLSPEDVCLIGDSMGDYEAAIDTGINFTFCEKYSNTPELKDKFQEIGIPVIHTLRELP